MAWLWLLILAQAAASGWQREFNVDRAELQPSGQSQYFILQPGYELVLEGRSERLVITVLDQTKVVGGVTTRIVEERETKNGKLVEVSRNFFAIGPRTGDVFYFGEEVDIYKDGKVAGHEGAWLSGTNGATFGLMVPGAPQPKMRYYQEIAPRVAMDRAEVVRLDARVTTPAGVFSRCLQTEETTELEPGAREMKYYAPGIGLIQDADLKLVRHGYR